MDGKICPVCKMGFSRKDNMLRHHRNKHGIIQPYLPRVVLSYSKDQTALAICTAETNGSMTFYGRVLAFNQADELKLKYKNENKLKRTAVKVAKCD
ncbi:hypothetical protein AM593_08010, partial [Mytilus galloprovincialis]